jgi:hypothetical protein
MVSILRKLNMVNVKIFWDGGNIEACHIRVWYSISFMNSAYFSGARK